ncbi:MAG: hypothetical protein QOC65_1096 [Sphingomonadales bacterium]|nr:hypothetical protein [Sphingomonadales bacterium]
MDLLAQLIAPIVSLWVIHNAIFSSARFVNEMRETVISGKYDRDAIAPDHGDAILADWKLCIRATIGVCLIFVIILCAVSYELVEELPVWWIGYAIALYPLLCAGGFAVCARGDKRLMKKAIARERARRADPRVR